MSLLLNHEKSSICTDGRLNLFSVPPTLAAFENIDDCKIYPVTALNPGSGGPISFIVNNLGVNTYLNLADSFFVIRARLRRLDGSEPFTVAAAPGGAKTYDNVTITNNIASTLVKNISVRVNDTVVSTHENFFLRNALDNLLHTPRNTRENLVKGCQHLYALGNDPVSFDSESWNERHSITQEGGEFEIIVPLNVDLGSTNKFFPPGTNLKVTLVPNEPEFYLVKSGEEARSHRLVIDDIYLQVTKALVLPAISEAHHQLFKKSNAVYPLRHVRTSERVIPVNTTSAEFDVFLPGQVPYNITLVFLPSTTLIGDPLTEPLFFGRHNLSHATLRSETKSIDYDFTNPRSAYHSTMRSLNEKDVNLDYDDYEEGGQFFIFFDLSDGTPSNALRPVYRNNLRLFLKWKNPTETALTMLMLTEGVGHLEIDSQGETNLVLK